MSPRSLRQHSGTLPVWPPNLTALDKRLSKRSRQKPSHSRHARPRRRDFANIPLVKNRPYLGSS
jgi:hypothetical protein